MEILEEVGEDNIFIFGQTVEGIENLRSNGYEPRKHYETDEELKAVLDWLSSDYFSPKEGNVLEDLPKSLLDWGDPFFVLADYRAIGGSGEGQFGIPGSRPLGIHGHRNALRVRESFHLIVPLVSMPPTFGNWIR